MKTVGDLTWPLVAGLLATACWIGCRAAQPPVHSGTPAEAATTAPAARADRKFTNRWYFWPNPKDKEFLDCERPGLIALQPQFLQLDDTMRWRMVNVPMYQLWCPNFAMQTGWRTAGEGKVEKVLLTPDGCKVLRRISIPPDCEGALPQVESTDGDGWGMVASVIVRFGAKEAKCIEPYCPSSGSCLVQSPRGTIWVYELPINERLAEFRRFDPATARYGPNKADEALNEFAFRAGHLELSCAIQPLALCNDAYVRTGGGWDYLTSPFDDYRVNASRYAVWRDRLLVSRLEEVLEYDLTRRRWVVLIEGDARPGGWVGVFDEKGRRIMGGDGEGIYVYDGDPFEAWDKFDEAIRPRIDRVLAGLDSDDWRQRELATKDLAELAKDAPDAVKMLQGDERLPAEARMRVRLVTSGRPASLHRRMAPTTSPAGTAAP